MDLFRYLMVKNGHNYLKDDDLFSYKLAKGQGGGTYAIFTGTTINATNTRRGKMKVNLLGNTSQTGTPTPDSPIPVNVVSGDNEVVVSNSDNTQSTSYPINLPDGMFLGEISTYKDSFFKAVTGNSIYDNLDSATKETLDYGEWYLEKKIGKVVLNGSETGWSSIQMSNVYGYYITIDNILSPSSATSLGLGLSNYFGIVTPGQNWGALVGSNNFAINNSNNTSAYVRFTKGEATNELTGFKTWLSTHNTIVYYVLATPTYTQITGTLKDELEALQGARSYDEQTNVSQVNNDLAANLEASILVNE